MRDKQHLTFKSLQSHDVHCCCYKIVSERFEIIDRLSPPTFSLGSDDDHVNLLSHETHDDQRQPSKLSVQTRQSVVNDGNVNNIVASSGIAQ